MTNLLQCSNGLRGFAMLRHKTDGLRLSKNCCTCDRNRSSWLHEDENKLLGGKNGMTRCAHSWRGALRDGRSVHVFGKLQSQPGFRFTLPMWRLGRVPVGSVFSPLAHRLLCQTICMPRHFAEKARACEVSGAQHRGRMTRRSGRRSGPPFSSRSATGR